MKNIQIKRTESLFKLVAFLSNLPIFSMYIQKDYVRFDEETQKSIYSYSTFNDICTFCRHVLYSIVAIFIYIAFGAILLNYLIIQPIIVLIGGSSLTGTITLVFLAFAVIWYALIIAYQNMYYAFRHKYLYQKNTMLEKPRKKEKGIFLKTFDLVSQKHSDFCKRIEVED